MIATLLHFNRKISGPLAAVLTLLASPVFAAHNIYEDEEAQRRYQDCLHLASLNPTAALSVAEQWTRAKGGAPAQHCAAVALVGLKRYGEAGAKLDALAHAPDTGDLRAELFDQAGNAWILAGQADKAVASLSSALALSAGDPDIYGDLARAQALQSDWAGVEADLNAALAMAPHRTDLLILRASARQAQGELREAYVDIQDALTRAPRSGDALVERGAIKRDSGDLAGARTDFEAALKLDPKGEVGAAAARNLAALKAAEASAPKPAPKKK